MNCPNCGAENRPERKFCLRCGHVLAQTCPACGTANEPDARFCGNCGAEISRGAQPAQAGQRPAGAATPVAERRLVSVLFADLVGFTSLSEGRDAEATRDLLTRYFDLARETLGRYGGSIEKFIGDAVMAVWGAPVAREDDAERAVRAALDLVAGIRTLDAGLEARAAVLTGEAAVTLGATGQGMVAGDIVNTASRLQAAAAPGSVLVGEATARAASRAIVFEPIGEQVLKGKTAPVPAWRALRVVAERGGRRRSEVLEPPFVGREDELRLLKDLFHATGRERRTRLVSITGQAGIGKSRLAWEFLKYVDGLVEEAWCLEGRCPAYGEGVPFWALGEMIRRRAGLAENDDERTTRERIAATVAEQVPDDQERRWIERALLALLGIEPPPPGGPDELFAAWRTFFERMATTRVCVLVFEDLQWADAGLLDFIDHVVEWSRGVPLLLITLARTELLDRRPDWGVGKRSFVGLALEPLSPASMRELLAGLIPVLPKESARSIVERAGGIPLYAVEIVRMLIEEKRLVADGEAYRPTADLGSLAVPETLHELVASRLDTLDAADRSILQDAAVLGQSFTVAALTAVSGKAAAELEPHLKVLVRRELLALHPDQHSPERGQYVFVQTLVREVAYGTLARPDRKSRHLAAARWLEAGADEERAGALAAHYLAAYRNAPEGPEADALVAQARISLKAAAARAAALGSPLQALSFLEQALEITTEPADVADLLERAGESASLATRHEAAETYLHRAIEIRRSLGDRAGVAHATAQLGFVVIGRYDYDAAVGFLEPAVEEFADLADTPEFIALQNQLARGFGLRGAYNGSRADRLRAVEICDHVLPAAERADLVEVVADCLITRGSTLCHLRRTYEGTGAIKTGIEVADGAHLRNVALRGRTNLSGMLEGSDRREGLALSKAAVEEGIRLGNRSMLGVALQNAAGNGLETGEWDWALEQCERALDAELAELDRATVESAALAIRSYRGEDTAAAMARLEMAIQGTNVANESLMLRFVVAFASGRLREAREAAMAHARIHGVPDPFLYIDAARCALWERDAAGAATALDGFVAVDPHGRISKADRRMVQAGIAALEGRRGEALAGFREALGEWRDLGLPWRIALTAITMAAVLGPDEPDVRAAADEARSILTRLGARPFLDRLDALLSPKAVESKPA